MNTHSTAPSPLTDVTCVVFDCDGVLVDAVSSWRTLHDHFGTDNAENLQRFIRGEITDTEFMRLDIKKWKSIEDPIHKDDLFRAYAGVQLIRPGTATDSADSAAGRSHMLTMMRRYKNAAITAASIAMTASQ